MKKISLLAVLIIGWTALSAQIKPKQEDWFSYSYTYDYLLDAPEGVDQNFIPNGHNISVNKDIVFGNSNFGMAYGLQYSHNSYYSNLGIRTKLSNGREEFRLLDNDTIELNKLEIQHLGANLELRFRTKPNSSGKFFRAYVGGNLGVRVFSRARLSTKRVIVQYNNLGALNRLKYGAYARIGYGIMSVYGYYGLSEMFNEGTLSDGTAVTPIKPLSVGISLSF